jgi:hypothetical protein
MMERLAVASPRLKARITGVIYLLYFLTAVSAEVFVGPGHFAQYRAGADARCAALYRQPRRGIVGMHHAAAGSTEP